MGECRRSSPGRQPAYVIRRAPIHGNDPLRRSGHPEELVAVVLVDGMSEGRGSDGMVTCFGAFSVRIVEGDPAFASHHVCSREPNGRLEVLRRLGRLCHDRDVVLASPNAHETFWDMGHVLRAGVGFLEAMRSLGDTRPADLVLLGPPETKFIELASSFGLPNCFQSHITEQARCAHIRAQLVWLAYIATQKGHREATRLSAAFQAWEALERARPIPF